MPVYDRQKLSLRECQANAVIRSKSYVLGRSTSKYSRLVYQVLVGISRSGGGSDVGPVVVRIDGRVSENQLWSDE